MTLFDDEQKEFVVCDDHWVVGRNEEEARDLAAQQVLSHFKMYRIFASNDLRALGRKMSKWNVVVHLEVINGITLGVLHKILKEGNLEDKELES
ncbi:hypothetical protein CQW23_14040 [Capsicum baccatum]|uniref:Uncharacterized protein n=1 Tax=Capsicum baccatum TaxID=33114 RepID=A0A2G2WI33_CAPBA|nr:hypothetical protein CQW23_14040 [Capsicum baccatum]